MTESLLEFPGLYSIKAMGKNEPDFLALVIDLVRIHAPDVEHTQATTRVSRNGRYLSVTVPVFANDRAQLDAIYQDLTDQARVIMAL